MASMKIPLSLHEKYQLNKEISKKIQGRVGEHLSDLAKQNKWFFVDRIKNEESFCQKIESGRFSPKFELTNYKQQIGDFYAASMVVQNLNKVKTAIQEIKNEPILDFQYMKPCSLGLVNHRPSEFIFDGVRLYFTTKKPISKDQEDLSFMVFEIQVKTFLDYAWGISSHDIGYKGNSFEWGISRIIAQNKAVLDSVELSLAEYSNLANNQAVKLKNKEFEKTQKCLQLLKSFWSDFPADSITLTRNIYSLMQALNLSNKSLKEIIQIQNANKSLSLSIYGSIVRALIMEKGKDFFDKINQYNKNQKAKVHVIIFKEINVEDIIKDFNTIKSNYSDFLIFIN